MSGVNARLTKGIYVQEEIKIDPDVAREAVLRVLERRGLTGEGIPNSPETAFSGSMGIGGRILFGIVSCGASELVHRAWYK